jgi:hypothetical protein
MSRIVTREDCDELGVSTCVFRYDVSLCDGAFVGGPRVAALVGWESCAYLRRTGD